MTNVWGVRIDARPKPRKFVNEQIKVNGLLRQGWGYDEKHNLIKHLNAPANRRNRSMFNKVKKGDLILVPRLPKWGEVSILKATEDWSSGYEFQIDPGQSDYGHKFPVAFVKSFNRNNSNVAGSITSTLKCRSRFWRITHLKDDVNTILEAKQTTDTLPFEDRLSEIVRSTFDESDLSHKLFENVTRNFADKKWENVIQTVISTLYPQYVVEIVQGKAEKHHGTDVLVKIPAFIGESYYGIAVQVKDYKNRGDKNKLKKTMNNAIQQVSKSDEYWMDDNSLNLIDRYVVFVEIPRSGNEDLLDTEQGVTALFAEDVQQLLSDYAVKSLGTDNVMKAN